MPVPGRASTRLRATHDPLATVSRCSEDLLEFNQGGVTFLVYPWFDFPAMDLVIVRDEPRRCEYWSHTSGVWACGRDRLDLDGLMRRAIRLSHDGRVVLRSV